MLFLQPKTWSIKEDTVQCMFQGLYLCLECRERDMAPPLPLLLESHFDSPEAVIACVEPSPASTSPACLTTALPIEHGLIFGNKFSAFGQV